MEDQQIGKRIWQYVSDNSLFLVLVILSLVAIVGPILLDRMGYFRVSLGFSEHIFRREVTHIAGGKTTGIDVVQDPRRAKTYWDWLQLLVVPATVAVAGFWFNKRQNLRQQRIEDQRAQDTALQEYLNKMSELLIDKELHEDPLPHGDTRVTARARTLTVLSQLDSTRKRRVLQFLREARLISSTGEKLEGRTINPRVVGLNGADLMEADLRGLRLVNADLSGADLSDADLRGADLSGADLSGAKLRGARGVVVFTDYALIRMRMRNITPTEVQKALEEASKSRRFFNTNRGGMNVRQKLGVSGRTKEVAYEDIVVAYEERGNCIKVVNAVRERKAE